MTPRCCPPPPQVTSDQDPAEELAGLARALGNPVRVRLLRHLLERDECIVAELVGAVSLAQSTVSQHLKVLRDARLIYGDVDGPRICYCVDRTRIQRLRWLLEELTEVTACVSP